MDEDAVLADYYASTEEGLDEIDIQNSLRQRSF